MKKGIILFLICLLSKTIVGQTTTYVFQPDSVCGKDALISSLVPNTNYGVHPDLLATAWTNLGAPVTGRSLLSFDFSGIPIGTTVVSATLDLFHYNDPYNIGHSNLSGPDDASLYRITQPWGEHSVTWNSQPTYTSVDSLFIPAAVSMTQNYSLNVKTLVQDMINNPINSFGFLFKENTEIYYRSMLFASSDNTTPALWPKLTLVLADSLDLSNTCTTIIPRPPVETPCGDLFIPTAFSPNNDGDNEFECVFGNCIKTLDFAIYDRWGEKVFETTDPKLCWDGTYKGERMNTAVFVYYIEVTLNSGEKIKKKGNISLIR